MLSSGVRRHHPVEVECSRIGPCCQWPVTVGAGVTEQAIKEAKSPGCGLAACATLGLVSISGMWVAWREFQCSDHLGVQLPCSCCCCMELAIERLTHVVLVMTHCRMSYPRIPKGAINVLPHCAYSPGCQRAVLQLWSRPAAHAWLPLP